jgi:hypothetical protein
MRRSSSIGSSVYSSGLTWAGLVSCFDHCYDRVVHVELVKILSLWLPATSGTCIVHHVANKLSSEAALRRTSVVLSVLCISRYHVNLCVNTHDCSQSCKERLTTVPDASNLGDCKQV